MLAISHYSRPSDLGVVTDLEELLSWAQNRHLNSKVEAKLAKNGLCYIIFVDGKGKYFGSIET